MARTKKVELTADINIPKDLHPKDMDAKYFGPEPKFPEQPEPHNRKIALMEGLSWYNRFYTKKEAKDFLINYLERIGRTDLVKKIGKVPDGEYKTTIGWVARLAMRGLTLNEQEQTHVMNEVDRLIGLTVSVEETMTGIKKEVNRPNVQEIMREKATQAGGEIEGIFDDFLLAGAPKDFNARIIDEVAKKNVLPQHISLVVDPWNKRLTEYTELQKGKDVQLNEAYARFSKTQVKNIIAFIEKVLAELNGYVSLKKSTKSPRAKKPISIEKQVSKLKYLKVFKDEALKLDLVSLHPTKLYGATEAWVYDTAKRKMHHYVADEYAKCFGIKGNTILGFDAKQSEVKTLRKPAEQIKALTGSKPAARKYFKDIKSVSVSPNGRFNENMVILKAF